MRRRPHGRGGVRERRREGLQRQHGAHGETFHFDQNAQAARVIVVVVVVVLLLAVEVDSFPFFRFIGVVVVVDGGSGLLPLF